MKLTCLKQIHSPPPILNDLNLLLFSFQKIISAFMKKKKKKILK